MTGEALKETFGVNPVAINDTLLVEKGLVCGVLGCPNTDDIKIVIVLGHGPRAVCPDDTPGGDSRGV